MKLKTSAAATGIFLFGFLPGLTYGSHETVDVSTITADRVKQFLDSGEKLLLIDLRPAKEFKQRRIPGARSIPMADLHSRLNEIPKSGRVILYSANPQNEILDQVFQFLEEKGYRNVAMMVEGFQGWVKRKYPVETERK